MHHQIFAGNEELDYAFMGSNPAAPDNVWLREAAERQVPLIYFLGVSPGRYQAIIPTFVVDWDARGPRAWVAFGEVAGATATATAPDPAERRYALRLVKQRLHQAAFRDGALAAYEHRCAISNLPDDHLLDAAHIMADARELLGQPVLANGIALSKCPGQLRHLGGGQSESKVMPNLGEASRRCSISSGVGSPTTSSD